MMLVEQKHVVRLAAAEDGALQESARGGDQGSFPAPSQLSRPKSKSVGDCGIPPQLKQQAAGHMAIS